jgi:hypothetical protein
MTEPVTGLAEWEQGQAQPHVPVTALIRAIAVLSQRVAADIIDTVPGSPTNGYAAIVASSGATGVLVGHEAHVVYYSDGWRFLAPAEGWLWYVLATGAYYRFNDVIWQPWSPLWLPVVEEGTTARAATPENAGEYTRFTDAAEKTFTFNGAEDFIVGAEYHGRNVGAGDLTLVGSGGMTITPPAGGTLVVPQDGTFVVKIVSATLAELTGKTVAV